MDTEASIFVIFCIILNFVEILIKFINKIFCIYNILFLYKRLVSIL